jgi:neutral/alkaline ceramidase-like enzyme
MVKFRFRNTSIHDSPFRVKWITSLALPAVVFFLFQSLLSSSPLPADESQANWKAGVATAVITPQQPMWMSGYAARTKPSEGKIHDLYAKVLALEDAQGTRLAIVTLDLLGIDRSMRDRLEKEVQRRYQLEPGNLLINNSHTHCGPVLRETRYSIYGDTLYVLSPEQVQQCKQYCEQLEQKIVQLIGEALDKSAPAQLAYTHARADFAMNRRTKTERGWSIRPNPDGPVDHDVPVLRVDSPEGKLRAVVFGYACHNTTLSFYKFCGDYAGFAQQYLEEAHPEVTALFMAGCGGDQNPYPRGGERTLEFCRQHGRALANGVESALAAHSRPIRGPLRTAWKDVTLDFAKPPSREQLEQQAKSNNKYERRHAECLLNELEQKGNIGATYKYPIQVVRFDNDLTLVALAGEVVVDYSLRLKQELAGAPVWVAAYSNDVFGYIPTVRILREGGYEGGGAMRYTPLPGPFAPSVEERIITAVHELVKKCGAEKALSSQKK